MRWRDARSVKEERGDWEVKVVGGWESKKTALRRQENKSAPSKAGERMAFPTVLNTTRETCDAYSCSAKRQTKRKTLW